MQKLLLTQCLGWEEGAVYRYNNKFFKIKHGLLVSSLTGKQNSWHVDWGVGVNEVFYLREATKIEPKKYYLKHKFLYGEALGSYLNYNHAREKLCLMGMIESLNYQTQFTEEEIEELEATGFDLCNFEKVEAEDE